MAKHTSFHTGPEVPEYTIRPMPATSSLLPQVLATIVSNAHVLTDADMRASYEVGWMRRWSGQALCVVRPGSVEDVAAVVRACASAGVPMVPQGGNTGLVGGSIPGDEPSVVVSMSRLRGVGTIDIARGQVDVGAGTTLEDFRAAVRGTGWAFGVDLASRSTATIGGMVATNAGGIRVVRNGMMRRQVIGVEVVLASGQVLRSMRGLEKDNTGYDLVGLMCGSEGTLGFVTEVKLQLVPHRPFSVTALIGLPNLDAVVKLIGSLLSRLPSLEAAEYISNSSMRLVCEHRGLATPTRQEHGAYLLVELADVRDPLDELSGAIGHLPSVVVGADDRTRESLWAYRENITESIAARGIPHKIDVSVPMHHLATFENDIEAMLAAYPERGTLYSFGHVADGNLHVNILTDEKVGTIDRAVFELVARYGGSVAAEHGVGRAKVSALSLTRSPVEIATMAAIKFALDPDGLLNPGVLLPAREETT